MNNPITQWFGDPGHAALAAFAVSIVSIGVSIWALVISHRTQRRSLEIEEARETDRLHLQKRARLVAGIRKDIVSRGRRSGEQHMLLVENTGEAEAREIVLTMDGQSVLEHPAIYRGQNEVRQVGPQSSFRYILSLTTQVRPPFDVEMTWTDDSGMPGQYRTTVTF